MCLWNTLPPTICLPLKITEASSKFYGICPNTDQVIYTIYSNDMPDIMIISSSAVLQFFCSQLSFTYYTICQSRKREIIKSNIYRILPKANSMPYIMILAQAVIQILWSQGPLWVKCISLKRGIIQSNIHRILQKVNQVPNLQHVPKLYAWYMYHDPSSSRSPNIYVTRLLYKMPKSDKGRNSAKYL